MKPDTLAKDLLHRINAYWRAPNCLSVGQFHLYDHSLLEQPLTSERIRPLEVGHWSTMPGQNFISVHLKRIIKNSDLDMFDIASPGHGSPAIAETVGRKTAGRHEVGSGTSRIANQ